MVLDTTGPLPNANNGNKYILVAIDHYSKWVEAKTIVNHEAKTITRFFEDDIICGFGVPKHVLMDNGR